MHLETVCSIKKELPFTINISLKEDRDKLDQIGQEIAVQEHLKYEGYSVSTTAPYSVDKGLPTLFFIKQ